MLWQLITALRDLAQAIVAHTQEQKRGNDLMSKTTDAIKDLTQAVTDEVTSDTAKDAMIADLTAKEQDAQTRLDAVDADDAANAAAIEAEVTALAAVKKQVQATPVPPTPPVGS